MTAQDRALRRRSEILGAAATVIAEKGYQETAIADIAVKLGIGHGTVYRYFDSKRHIAENVIEYVIDKIALLVADVDPDSAETLEDYAAQIGTLGNRLFDFFLTHRDLAAVFFFESYGVDKTLTGRMQEAVELFGSFVERYLDNGCRKGFLRSDLDVEITARAINGMILAGALRAFQAADPDAQRDRWIDAIRTLMLSGMAA